MGAFRHFSRTYGINIVGIDFRFHNKFEVAPFFFTKLVSYYPSHIERFDRKKLNSLQQYLFEI